MTSSKIGSTTRKPLRPKDPGKTKKPPRKKKAEYSWGCQKCRGTTAELFLYCGGWPSSKHCVWCGSHLGQQCQNGDCRKLLPRSMLYCDQCGTVTDFHPEHHAMVVEEEKREVQEAKKQKIATCCYRCLCTFAVLAIITLLALCVVILILTFVID